MSCQSQTKDYSEVSAALQAITRFTSIFMMSPLVMKSQQLKSNAMMSTGAVEMSNRGYTI